MKLEVGMYVRTKITDNCNCVYIRKITEIDNGKALFNQICIDEDVIDGWGDERIWIDEEDISKSSHDIMEIIEVGDIVTTNVIYHGLEKKTYYLKRINNSVELDTLKSYVYHNKRVIKSIVTKEQFSSMEYKVGE